MVVGKDLLSVGDVPRRKRFHVESGDDPDVRATSFQGGEQIVVFIFTCCDNGTVR